MNRSCLSMLKLLALWAAALGLLSACGGNDGGAADAPVRPSIGAAGGSMSSADGAFTLTIPPGALGKDTEIVITEVSAANQPATVQALGADKVYRLEPSGLQFAKPASMSLNLPPSPSGQIAVAVVHSAGTWEWVAAQSMTVETSGRSISGQLSHFSELAVKTLDITHSFDIQPRELAPGGELAATFAVGKSAEMEEVTVTHTSQPTNFYLLAPETLMKFVSTTATGSRTLPNRVASAYSTKSTYQCVKAHAGEVASITSSVELGFPANLAALIVFGEAFVTVTESKQYECKGTESEPEPQGAIRTGLHPMPAGMRGPDGIAVTLQPFATLKAYVALVGGHNGALGIDLLTGDEVLNQTAGAPDGQFGNAALMGALPVSAPNPGASTPAALFGTSAIGGAVRGYNLPPPAQGSFFRWGPTLLTQTQVLDAATPGGGLVADEVMTTVPGTGLNFYRRDSDRWLQTIEQVRAFNFDGALRAAVLPEAGLNKPLLALTAGSDNGSTSTVWYHSRQPNAPAVKLFSMIPGAKAARRLRCQTWDAVSAQIGKVLCAATEPGGSASFFSYDPANPTATPAVTTLAVGAGATGVQFGRRANGNTFAVVANFVANTLNIIDFDAAANLLGNRSQPVPEGCLNPPHAAPFTAGGQDYIAGTCNDSDNYFVIRHDF